VYENSGDDSGNDHCNFSMEKKSLLKEVIHGMEQRSVISEQQVISVYKTKEQFLRERPGF
jgi:hypothetical protein